MKFISLFLVLAITQVFSDDLEDFKTLILDEIKTLQEENTQLNETLNKYGNMGFQISRQGDPKLDWFLATNTIEFRE